MAERDKESENKSGEAIGLIWFIPGVAAGLPLSAKYGLYLQSTGNENTWLVIFLAATLGGPMFLLALVADACHEQIKKGKMSWEEYWIVLSGIVIAMFAFLGITGIDDITEAADVVFGIE